jgi:putative phosphoesterase
MRVALIADIHGNPFALDAVLNALAVEGVDQIVCLGDVAMFGPAPRATLERIRELGCTCVMGNTDAWALDPKPHTKRDEFTERYNAIELWCAAQLTESDFDFIRTFQPMAEVAVSRGAQMICYHGSPRSFHDPVLATTSEAELAAMFDGCRAPIMAGAHTHTQLLRRYLDMLIVNPGSVGQPFEYLPGARSAHNPPWAEFAIVEGVGDDVSVEFRRTPFDHVSLVTLALNSGMPYAEWWATMWS